MIQAADLRAQDLRVGATAQFSRELTQADVDAFADASGDHNPLHVDQAYALTTGFGNRIAHGAFQLGLASALIGMQLPGKRCLLTSMQAKFPAPLRVPTRVLVRGDLVSWNASTQSGQIRIIVLDEGAAMTTAEIISGFTLHEVREVGEVQPERMPPKTGALRRRLAIVTGASGGLGAAIIAALIPDLDVLAVVNRGGLSPALAGDSRVQSLTLDFGAPDWSARIELALQERELFGVVHAAWPGMPHAGLLTAPPETLQRQIEFATTHTIALARLLQLRAGDDGGRMVALGSIAGQRKPALSTATYSLAKATLEHTVKLLAPELARKRITINTICPSFIPTGMNEQTDARARKFEMSRVPLGRLCTPDDVAATVQFLFSDGASFLTGESIVLSGGQS